MLGSKQRTYGMYICFLSTLGVYVTLFCILSHLPKTGIYRRRFDIYTVDELPNCTTKKAITDYKVKLNGKCIKLKRLGVEHTIPAFPNSIYTGVYTSTLCFDESIESQLYWSLLCDKSQKSTASGRILTVFDIVPHLTQAGCQL